MLDLTCGTTYDPFFSYMLRYVNNLFTEYFSVIIFYMDLITRFSVPCVCICLYPSTDQYACRVQQVKLIRYNLPLYLIGDVDYCLMISITCDWIWEPDYWVLSGLHVVVLIEQLIIVYIFWLFFVIPSFCAWGYIGRECMFVEFWYWWLQGSMVSPYAVHQQQLAFLSQQQALLMAASKSGGISQAFVSQMNVPQAIPMQTTGFASVKFIH